MAKTYTGLMSQIQKLQSQAETLKKQEVAGVVKRIKEAISAYGLTKAELFGKTPVTTKSVSAKKKKPTVSPVKYSDGNGHAWGGRGPKPRWLKDALASGKSIADLHV